MKKLTIKQRFNRLDRMIEQGLVIRQQWTEGEERACLLAAISPEVGDQKDSSACPTSLLPRWFAYLTPTMDDHGTMDAWPTFIKRYASVVRKASSVLDAAGWGRAEYSVRALAVQEAMRHTKEQATLDACKTVVDLCLRVVAGEEISEDERSAAESAARSAAASAAESAAESAAWSAAASAAESAAWSATASAAESAAWDRMSTAILDVLENETKGAKQ